jgi:hypothetical protein
MIDGAGAATCKEGIRVREDGITTRTRERVQLEKWSNQAQNHVNAKSETPCVVGSCHFIAPCDAR